MISGYKPREEVIREEKLLQVLPAPFASTTLPKGACGRTMSPIRTVSRITDPTISPVPYCDVKPTQKCKLPATYYYRKLGFYGWGFVCLRFAWAY